MQVITPVLDPVSCWAMVPDSFKSPPDPRRERNSQPRLHTQRCNAGTVGWTLREPMPDDLMIAGANRNGDNK